MADTVEKLGNLAKFLNGEDYSLSAFLYSSKMMDKYGLSG